MEAARRHGADEIVIGTRHRGRLAALQGSVARELLERTDRPVILVPAATAGSHRVHASAPA
jgi:nucleotide-binding universal stress UspA family protein